MTSWDLIIVGGGATGLALSLALRGLPLRVLRIERPPAEMAASDDVRALALSYSSLQILQALGLAPESLGQASIRQIRISEQRALGRCLLDARETSQPYFGQVVPLSALQQALSRQCQAFQRPSVQASVQQLAATPTGWQLSLDSGEILDCRWLVIADGGQAQWRQSLELEQRQLDYGQTALSCWVQVQSPQPGLAFEHFTPQGPLALLPLDAERYSLVWSLKPESARALQQASQTEFLSALQQAFGWPLGALVQAGPRQCFELSLTETKSQSGPGFVLVGNALRQLHPVAGQGFNLALRDVAALAELLAQRLREPELPDDWLEREYRLWRLADQDRMLGFTHSMVSLFSNRLPLCKALRTGLLLGLSQSRRARRELARLAMGLGGRVPVLATGLKLEQL